MMATMMLGQAEAAEDFRDGERLYADVARFASFGSHRLGSPADDRAHHQPGIRVRAFAEAVRKAAAGGESLFK